MRGLRSKEAEEAVLGSLLIDPDAIERVLGTGLVASDFHYSVSGIIFAAISELYHNGGPPADYILVSEKLRQSGQLKKIGGQARLTGLINDCATSIHAVHYAGVVRELARKRRYVQLAGDVMQLAHEEGPIGKLEAGAAKLWTELRAEALYQTVVRSAADILASIDQVPPDVVAGFLPGHEPTILAGHGGTGKGYVCLDLATQVSQGLPWLGMQTQKVPVLVIDRENTEPRLHRRLRRIMAGHELETAPDIYFVYDVRTRLSDAGFVGEIVALARRVSAGLIILDSLADFLGGLDENSNPEMALVAAKLRAIAVQSEAALLGQHHTPKASAGKTYQSARGASSLFDGVHCVIQLIRDGDVVTLRQEKNRGGPELTIKARVAWDSVFDWSGKSDSFSLSLLSASAGRQSRKSDPDEVAIKKVLGNGDWRLSNEVVKEAMAATNHKRSTVHSKLKGMVGDLILDKTDQGAGKPYLVRLVRDRPEKPSMS